MASSMAAKVSVRVPIWLTLMRIELPTPALMPSARISVGRGQDQGFGRRFGLPQEHMR